MARRRPVRLEPETPPVAILPTSEEVPQLHVDLILPAMREPQPGTLVAAPPAGAVETAATIEAAVDRVAGNIREQLQDGDLLVVWLLDASESMVVDRPRVAARLEPLLEQMASGADAPHQVLQAIVAFGATIEECVAPTPRGGRGLSSALQWPVDASGKENVFTAVEQCVATYRKKWPHKRMMIVVWTDESGDDAARVEQTIRICREHGVSVSVVGPSAVLGADTGVHAYEDPESRQVFPLPVTRGPDSAVPERLELDYWFVTQDPPTELSGTGFGGTDLPAWYGNPDVPNYKCYALTELDLPSWYGSSDLKGLVSGFSPYALTRLTWQTGGTYIISDRDENRGPFRADTMPAYLPDYRSADEYLRDVPSHPLRRAVSEAVQITRGKQLGPPPTILFGTRAEFPRYGVMRTYLPPGRFVHQFRATRRSLKDQADRTSRIVELALARVSQGSVVERGLEDEYAREPSRRWQAWYDLTRGRLLATSVRLEEYRLTCDRVLDEGFLHATTNHLLFVPSREMKSDSGFRRRAAEAERLLTRCVTAHAHTPWAWLAQRELDYGLGLEVRQHVLTPVPMPRNNARPFRPPKL